MDMYLRPSWETIYMSMCYLIAYKSPDMSTKVGAVITTEDNVHISSGYNGIPRNIEHEPHHQIRPGKYLYFEHAERNSVYNAARTSARLDIAHTMYITWLPCADCARSIIQATNVKRLVVHKQGQLAYQHSRGDVQSWDESQGAAVEMLSTTGIDIDWYDGPILAGLTGFFTGNLYAFEEGEFYQLTNQ